MMYSIVHTYQTRFEMRLVVIDQLQYLRVVL